MKLWSANALGLVVLGSLVLNLSLPVSVSSRSLPEAAEQAKMATVGILRHAEDDAYKSVYSEFAIRGSGVHLGDGYILTARHVVDRQEGGNTHLPDTIRVLSTGFSEWQAKLVGSDRFLDLALYRLQVAGKNDEVI